MKFQSRFDYSILDHNQNNTAHLVVSVAAPAIDWVKQRPKTCILPVLDVSGSMHGPKLHYAKTAISKLIEQLAPGDFAGLMLFESKSHLVVEPCEITAESKVRLLKAVEAAEIKGGTNFSDALSKAMTTIHRLDLPPSFLHRVILFTDGQPTEGIADQEALKSLVRDQRGRVTLSFFGFGDESNNRWSSCDHAFLTDLSQDGRGNYAYVQNPDDALAAFGKELGGLLSTYASDVKIVIEPVGGHRIRKVISDVPYETSLGEHIFDLGTLLAEETRHLVLEVELQKQPNAFPRDTKVFSVGVQYMRVTQEGPKVAETLTGGGAKVRFVKSSDVVAQPAEELATIIGLHRMVRSQLDAEAEAKKGNFQAAQEIMTAASNDFQVRGWDAISAAARDMATRLSSQAAYTASQGFLRSMQVGSRGMGASALSADASAFYADIGVALNNSSQEAYTTVFTGNSTEVPGWTYEPPSR